MQFLVVTTLLGKLSQLFLPAIFGIALNFFYFPQLFRPQSEVFFANVFSFLETSFSRNSTAFTIPISALNESNNNNNNPRSSPNNINNNANKKENSGGRSWVPAFFKSKMKSVGNGNGGGGGVSVDLDKSNIDEGNEEEVSIS